MNIAIIENNVVTNVIVCDSFEMAKELTGVLEVQDADPEQLGIGHFREDGVWYSKCPHPSWVLDKEKKQWFSPLPYPEDGKAYYWDEPTLRWVEVV